MGDKQFTLLELHFDGDVQFGPKTMGIPGEGEEEKAESDSGESMDIEGAEDVGDLDLESGGPGAGTMLLALLLLVGVAVGVKKFLSGDDDSETVDVE